MRVSGVPGVSVSALGAGQVCQVCQVYQVCLYRRLVQVVTAKLMWTAACRLRVSTTPRVTTSSTQSAAAVWKDLPAVAAN